MTFCTLHLLPRLIRDGRLDSKARKADQHKAFNNRASSIIVTCSALGLRYGVVSSTPVAAVI